ncbi:hypothetical protein N7535_003982 [Penicillium sp. DV-2018c]|nr:hypothetical protein N7535_003982 [Penicillium sp. DV-2018c]
MTGECSYDCSVLPETIQFDADITGTGVIIGYTATAGLVVTIIILHYCLAYKPTQGPFRHDDERASLSAFQPNQTDLMILKALRIPFKRTARLGKFKPWNLSRFDSSMTKVSLL